MRPAAFEHPVAAYAAGQLNQVIDRESGRFSILFNRYDTGKGQTGPKISQALWLERLAGQHPAAGELLKNFTVVRTSGD